MNDLEDLQSRLTAALARIEGLEEEVDECDMLLEKQAKILTGVANVLNGPPPEHTTWSHHDLIEKAKDLKTAYEFKQVEKKKG